MLHAQLEIWKAAVEESPRNTLAASWSPAGVVQSPSSAVASPTIGNTPTTGNLKESPCTVDFSDGTFFFLLARLHHSMLFINNANQICLGGSEIR